MGSVNVKKSVVDGTSTQQQTSETECVSGAATHVAQWNLFLHLVSVIAPYLPEQMVKYKSYAMKQRGNKDLFLERCEDGLVHTLADTIKRAKLSEEVQQELITNCVYFINRTGAYCSDYFKRTSLNTEEWLAQEFEITWSQLMFMKSANTIADFIRGTQKGNELHQSLLKKQEQQHREQQRARQRALEKQLEQETEREIQKAEVRFRAERKQKRKAKIVDSLSVLQTTLKRRQDVVVAPRATNIKGSKVIFMKDHTVKKIKMLIEEYLESEGFIANVSVKKEAVMVRNIRLARDQKTRNKKSA